MKTKILYSVCAVLALLYFVFRLFGLAEYSVFLKPFLVPILTITYFLTPKVKKQSLYFKMFLLLYSLSELMLLGVYSEFKDAFYYYNHSMSLVAMLCLILDIVCALKNLKVLKKFKVQISILFLSIVSVMYYLSIQNGFSFTKPSDVMELLYLFVILLALAAALIFYLGRPTQRSILLFVGILLLLANKFIDCSFFFVRHTEIFFIISSVLFILAFYLLFYQSQIEHKDFKFVESKSVIN